MRKQNQESIPEKIGGNKVILHIGGIGHIGQEEKRRLFVNVDSRSIICSFGKVGEDSDKSQENKG